MPADLPGPRPFDYIALYGAGLSSILFIFEIYKYFSDKARFRLEVVPSIEIFVDSEKKPHYSGKVKLRVFNDGRRSCTFLEVGYVNGESFRAKLRRVVF